MTGARLWVLAVLLAPLAWTAAPAYTLASVVNSATGVPGDFAPNGMVSIYGTNLAYGTEAAGAGETVLPKTLAGVTVFVNGNVANLFYVSPTQINFLIPSDLLPGTKTLWVTREGLVGPTLSIVVKETAPGLFMLNDGSAIATHVDGSLVSGDSPAAPGEIVVIYAAGLGRTTPEEAVGRASVRAAPILLLNQLMVLLGGVGRGSGQRALRRNHSGVCRALSNQLADSGWHFREPGDSRLCRPAGQRVLCAAFRETSRAPTIVKDADAFVCLRIRCLYRSFTRCLGTGIYGRDRHENPA